ncbi:MAG: NAD(P)-dependent oxidoreductase, partial [Polaromonas sp.]
MKPAVLLVSRLPDSLVGRLHERFDCHVLAELDDAGLQALAPRLRGMVATGESVVARELIARLPALEVISVLGVGYDGIDMAAARERKVVVAHTPGLSTNDIADFAMALLLTAARQVVNADRFVRSGGWTAGRFPMTRRVSGARLGIVGLGRIGRAVATRAQAFGMDIAYTGRTPKADVGYRWCIDARTLAASVDFLVVCASGGADTRALIDGDVLAALGPS